MNRNDPIFQPFTPLPTSASLSYITSPSLPTTPSLLSRHHSRSSLNNLAPSKSHPNITSAPSSSFTAAPNARTTHQQESKRKRRPLKRSTEPAPASEDDWLTRTASVLTINRLEEKGQSWLIARESSTALDLGEEEDLASGRWARRGAGGDQAVAESPEVGRSKYASARSSFTRLGGGRSRRESAVGRGMGALDEGGSGKGQGEVFQGPDFVDARDVAEAMGLDGEGDEGREGADEEEMGRVVLGRMEGWVDWAVGWMDVRGDEEDEGDDGNDGGEESLDADETRERMVDGLDVEEIRRRLDREAERDREEEDAVEIGPPPGEGGWMGDAKWLFGVAKRIAL